MTSGTSVIAKSLVDFSMNTSQH